MNFDIFDDIDVLDKYKGKVIDSAKSAERNIMVSPYNALLNARVSLENLCKAIIKSNHLEHIREDDGSVNLATMIETCVSNGAFRKKDEAHIVRLNGNKAAHGKDEADQLHIVNVNNVRIAMDSVKNLFDILAEVFPENADGAMFDVNKVPFGFYEIERAVHKGKNEVIFGDYNYFVKDPKNNYYYFQVIPRNSESTASNDLGARSIITGNRIKEDKKRTSYLLDVYYPSNLMAESDRDYIAYSVYSDSRLLSEVRSGTLNEKQTVQVAIDILNVLLELKGIGDGIHLRNIQPSNVIITPDGENYMASVVNMETAKINNYDATVFASMKALIDTNPFLPKEVLNANNGAEISWEKVDVYSVAVIMVYCMDESNVKEAIDTYALYDIFSDEIVGILEDIFDSSINQICGIAEFKEKLENALEEL
jgi:serine/threonine protein kinase